VPDQPPTSPHRVHAVLLAVYVVLLAMVLFQPVPTVASGTVGRVDEWLTALGAPAAVTVPGRVEMMLNAAMFAPVALLAALTWPGVHWASWVAYGFVGSALVEVVQGLLLSARSAELVDVVANTLGALVGAVLGQLVPKRSRV
jgi:glycopeptide antibiotics resistance protein